MYRFIAFILSAYLFSTLCSCTTQNLFTKQVKRPATLVDSVFAYVPDYQYTIRTDDKISISVWDHAELSVGSLFDIYNSNEVYGKWLQVDANGNISAPKIGDTRLQGLTVVQAEELLKNTYKKWIVNPIIKVKVLNKEITILGELRTPGKYSMEKDNYTLLDIIGKAGDFDLYANKKNVQIIRMVNGQPKEVTVDLTDYNGLAAANIQVHPDDIIYVPSRKGKHWDKRAGSTLVPIASAVSSLALVAKFIF